MPSERIPTSQKPAYRHILEAIIAGRDTETMRRDVAQALTELTGIPNEKATVLLAEISPRKVIREGLRMQSVQEFFAIIEKAAELHRASSNEPKTWPTIDELATALSMQYYGLNDILRSKSFPKGLRELIVRIQP